MVSGRVLTLIRALLFVACLLPLSYLLWRIMQSDLGPDPAETVVRFLGSWALNLLWITLAVTPLRLLTAQAWLLRLRRMLGLYALFYASLHLLAYLGFLLQWEFALLADDLVERPYIVAGFTALLMLIPLGITSTRGWQRRLGMNWKRLHRLIYPASGLAILHFFWQARADLLEQFVYLLLLILLMGIRVHAKLRPPLRKGGVVP